MCNPNFIALASYCVNRHQNSLNQEYQRYIDTLFVAISHDNSVKCSTTPHLLQNAEQCILVHHITERAISNWYSWYKVETINKDGCVYAGTLERGFSLVVKAWNGYANQMMSLYYGDKHLYWCKAPWELHIPRIWELYSKLVTVDSSKEIELIAELYRKDEEILKLESDVEDFSFTEELLKQERNQYKGMIDEIKDLLEHKE
jgi:hypothetical protein